MDKITSRAVLGHMKNALTVEKPPAWIPLVSNEFPSDQDSEEYPWLDATGPLREWIGGRNAKGFKENSLTIVNKHFEGTVEVLVKDLRRDKFGMIKARINDLVSRAKTHPASLLSTLMLNGASTACYDGQYFFSTTHSEGESGTQSNSITIDISAYPVIEPGTVALPAVAEFQYAIAKAIEAMAGFKDSAGEPINENMMNFIVMVPVQYMNVALQAVATPVQIAETQSALQALKGKFNIEVVPNTRLSTLYSSYQFTVFNTDGYIKPFIFQRETNYNVGAKAEGSEYEFDNAAHQYGLDYWGNVSYALWQKAVLVTLG